VPGFQNMSFNARNVRKAQRRVDDQRARLHSMIVRGFPTRSAEDLLCTYYVTLRQLSTAHGNAGDGTRSAP
jgi:hypothetical protein